MQFHSTVQVIRKDHAGSSGQSAENRRCGAVEKFTPSLIELGFDILNPVQCPAVGMVEAVREFNGK